MIPAFRRDGSLPPGRHKAHWAEFYEHYALTTNRRRLLWGLRAALLELKAAGCRRAFIGGSLVTAKDEPSDFDGCWEPENVDPDRLDPILLRFDDERLAQKAKYLGELFPSSMREEQSQLTFLEFFQHDAETDELKGMIEIDLETML